MNILLGVTGSVAACLTPKMVTALQALGDVRVVITEAGLRMAPTAVNLGGSRVLTGTPRPGQQRDLPLGWVRPDTDADEWPGVPWQKGDPVLHINLKNWADILVIAPLSANTLAKMANGLSDNLLTTLIRAWPEWKPLFVAPAMNSDMWDKPVTQRHLDTLGADFRAFTLIPPQSKVLACGDEGVGAMANIADIVKAIQEALRWKNPLWQSPLFIPEAPHPGGFGATRKHDTHTGVDLYCCNNAAVGAVEPGVVVDIIYFTGSKVTDQAGKPLSWWNDTQAVMVKGASGVVIYGEIQPYTNLTVGAVVSRGEGLGTVAAVLPKHKFRPDIPNHSTSMLHIELYTSAAAAEKDFQWDLWPVGGAQPNGLRDPTPYLKDIK